MAAAAVITRELLLLFSWLVADAAAPQEGGGNNDPASAVEQFMDVVDQARATAETAPTFSKKAFWPLSLDRDHFPRKLCIMIIDTWWFDPFILFLILCNTITMTLFKDPPLENMIKYQNQDFKEMSPNWAAGRMNVPIFEPIGGGLCPSAGPCSIGDVIELFFLILFTVEMTIKIGGYGFWFHPNAYLTNAWNWLDFVVVIIGYIDMFGGDLAGISTLRLVKTLRPLRTLQRVRGMKVLVNCIIEALPQMCNVLIFLIFVIIFFGLFGVAFFKGALRHTCHSWDGSEWASLGTTCNAECDWDELGRLLSPCRSLGNLTRTQENYYDPIAFSYSCRPDQQCRCESNGLADPTCSSSANPNYGITSFDSLPWAMISLFQAISLEGWVDMMYALMDGSSCLVFLYFVAVVFLGAIIVMNLFLAVLCDNFDMADKDAGEPVKEESGEAATARALKSLEHKNPVRKLCLYLVKLKYFDWFIQGCILINTVFMMMKYSPQPQNPLEESVANVAFDDRKWDVLPFDYWMFLCVANILLTSIFAFESVVKIVGLGRLFCRDWMNLFDLVVVIFSVVEIIFDLMSKFSTSGFRFPLPLSVLRAFRIFRLFKLVRSIESMRKILTTLAQSLASVFYLALLLGLIVLIFILLGQELFGGFYPRPELNYTSHYFPDVWTNKTITWGDDLDWPSRYHFDDFGNAFLAIYVVLSGENWNEIMFNNHEATWDATPGFAILYFIGLFVIGNLLLFNLFIAILLSNFDDDEEEEEEEEEEEDPAALEGATSSTKDGGLDRGDSVGKVKAKKEEPMMRWHFDGYHASSTTGVGESARKSSSGEEAPAAAAGEDEDEESKPAELFPKDEASSNGDKSMMIFSWQNPIRIACARLVSHWAFENTIVLLILVSTVGLLLDMPHLPKEHPMMRVLAVLNIVFAIIFTLEMIIKWITHGIFKSKTPSEYVLAEPYFAVGWNWLDFFIVIVSILVLFNIPSLNALRVFRALRPLRLVSRNEDLKITVMTLAYSVPAMGSLILVATLFFLIFAILGLELYGGRMGYCKDPLYEDEAHPFGGRVVPGLGPAPLYLNDYQECMALPRYNLTRRTTDGILLTEMAEMCASGALTGSSCSQNWLDYTEFPQWIYPQFGNFDHLGTSLFLLFEISALEGWPDVMHVAMDTDADEQFIVPWRLSTYEDTGMGGVGQPMEAHTAQGPITAIFFCMWIFMGCFVVVNMTVGVVCDTFSQIKAKNDGLLLMTEDAADWVKAQRQVLATRPLISRPPPESSWRMNVYYLVTSQKFELTITVIILLNMLQMGCDWWEPQVFESTTFYGDPGVECGIGESPSVNRCVINAPFNTSLKGWMFALNLIFLVIYIGEMIVKWIGLGVVQYFKNSWDAFDCLLVTLSTVEVILSSILTGGGADWLAVIRVLRLFRVMRLVRVIKTAKQLRTIILTVWISLPQLQNIMLLMGLIIVIADCLCVFFFWSVNYTPGNFDPTSDHNNSRSVGEVLAWAGECPSWGCGDPARHNRLDAEPFAYQDDGTNWGDMINRHANFQYWWTGILLLIRSATGESFNGLMHDCFGAEWGHNRLTCCPQCGPIVAVPMSTLSASDIASRISSGEIEVLTLPESGQTITRYVPNTSCGNTPMALLIYLAFQMIMAYIVLSIMIGVILENFGNVGSETRKISMEHLEDFREVWLKYDPKGTFIVPSHNLLAILQQLKHPLGIADAQPAMTRTEMLKHLGNLDIPDHGGYIHFLETLTAISHAHAGEPVPVCDTTKKMQKMAANLPNMKRLDAMAGKPVHNALTNYLVSLLQSRWRGYAMRQKYDNGTVGGDAAQAPPPPYELAPPKVKASQVMPEPQ